MTNSYINSGNYEMRDIMIIREKYLSKIRPFNNKDLIKVIIGIRGSGKTVILKQIINELVNSGIDKEQIIYINFEFEDYYDICNHKDFNKYIEDKIITFDGQSIISHYNDPTFFNGN